LSVANVAYADDIAEPVDGEEDQAEPAPKFDLHQAIQAPNIADLLDDSTLNAIGTRVVEEFEIDLQSRKGSGDKNNASSYTEGWEDRHDRALKAAMQVKEAKSYPWPKASNVKYPLITTAAIQFNARAYPAIVDGPNLVKGQVLGKPSPDKTARADRIARHMSYQLLDEMEEWEGDTDQLLCILPVTGTVFRKCYFDPIKGRNCSEIVTADKYVVNYWATGDCPRGTHVLTLYPHQILERQRSGIWTDVELGLPADANNDLDAPHEFLEQNRLWDLDDDGYPEPYCVTVHKETRKVVRIKARFEADGIKVNAKGEIARIEPMKYVTKYGFIPSLDGSYYDIGFGFLLDAINDTVNSTINMLMDAAHLSNTQGGLIGSGVSIKSGQLRFQPGEWKKVDASGGSLKDNVVPLPVKEPSPVLFNLLGMLIEAGKEIAATKDILTGETNQAQQPVGTVLAMIEQGLKVYSAIIKRVHRALKAELGVLFELNRIYLNPEVYYTFQDEEGVVAQQDYASKDVDVKPVSDPSMATDMQRLGRAQFMLATFRGDPNIDQVELDRRVAEAAGVQDIQTLLKPPQGPPPEAIAQAAELEMKQREVEVRERDVAIKEATAKANIANLLATALSTLSQIGVPKAPPKPAMGEGGKPAPDGPVEKPEPEISPAIAHAMDGLMAIAEREIGDASVRQPVVSGVAGQSPDAGVPAVPEGPPASPGGPMDDGNSVPALGAPGGADGGVPNGGAVGP
jgi:chaperonin GroES